MEKLKFLRDVIPVAHGFGGTLLNRIVIRKAALLASLTVIFGVNLTTPQILDMNIQVPVMIFKVQPHQLIYTTVKAVQTETRFGSPSPDTTIPASLPRRKGSRTDLLTLPRVNHFRNQINAQDTRKRTTIAAKIPKQYPVTRPLFVPWCVSRKE